MRKLLILAATVALLVLAAASPAFAHVTLEPGTALVGASDVTLRFRVPNEEDNSTTNKVELFLPTDHPIAGIAVEPKPGWNVSIETTKLAKPIHTDDGDITNVVSHVTWSGGSIGTGQFDEFTVIAGSLPDTPAALVFKAIQTYANGDVVRWIDVASGSAQPDHPAPTLTLTAVKAAKASKRVNVALGLGLVAVILSGIGTGIAITARRK